MAMLRPLRVAATALCLLIGASGWLALGSAPAMASLSPPAPLPSTLFSYPDFTAPSGPSLNLLGQAQISASALQLVGNDESGPTGGAAWYANPVDVETAWESQFTFQLPANGGSPEGLAFVIQGQSATARGADGPNLGFAGITHSLAVEIGLTSNPAYGDPAAPFVSIQTGGAGQNTASMQDSIGLSQSGSVSSITGSGPHTITVVYLPPLGSFPGELKVDLDQILQPVAVATPFDLGTDLGLANGQAWVGLTAANGSAPNTETADINSWSSAPNDTASELAVTSSAVSGQPGAQATQGPITVSLESCGGAPPPSCADIPVDATADLTVSLQSSSPGGVFAATSGGPPVTSVTIPAGSTSATFFYGDTQPGSPVITAAPQATGVADASQTETIIPPPLAVTTTSLPGGTVGRAYNQTLSARGGITPYSWSVSSGSLPPGLSLDASTGVISGTPTAPAISGFTVQVTDAENPQASAGQMLSITVGPGAVTAVVAGSQAYGSSAPTFTETNDAPSGVTVSGSLSCTTVNGGTAISPSLAAGGSYAIDGSSCSGLSVPAGYALSYASGTFTVNPAAQSISFTAPATGVAGGSATLTATGGGSDNPVTFSVDSSSGAGVCSVSGNTVSYLAAGNCVIDANQAENTDYLAAPQVSQTIAVKSAALSVTTTHLAGATLGTGYAATLAAAGGTTPYTWSVSSGSLPPGLSLNASAGTIAGTPDVAGTFTFTVQATDSSSPVQTATAPLSVGVGVGATGTTITGTHSGALTIGPGVTSIAGAILTGPVTIKAGAVVSITGSTLDGSLAVSGAASLAVCGSTVDGSLQVANATGPVLLGGSGTSACAADTFRGSLALSGNAGNLVLAGAKIGGAAAVANNTGGTLLAGNTIGGPLACSGNNPPPTDGGQPNAVSGGAAGQCATLAGTG
jgi:Putative Ig domain/Legume lectin domain